MLIGAPSVQLSCDATRGCFLDASQLLNYTQEAWRLDCKASTNLLMARRGLVIFQLVDE